MAHNLAFDAVTGQYRMFSAIGKRGAPWHNLGQMVKDAQTWQQAAQLAHLDYTVSKRILYGQNPGDAAYNPLDAWGIFRDDNNAFLGTVGRIYEPIQIAKAFDFCDTLLEAEKGAHYESAGALGSGERFWVLARVPYQVNIAGTDDTSNAFLLFESSHDGTMSATGKICLERVVCENTLTIALSENSAAVKIRHTKSGTEKLETAKKLLSGVRQTVQTISDKLNLLAHRKTNKEVNLKVMGALFGDDWKDSPRKREQIAQIAQLYDQNDHGAIPQIKGSAYNLLNAVTEYADHFKPVRITAGKEGMHEQQVRAEGAIFGGCGEQLKQKALETILEYTEACPEQDYKISVPVTSDIPGTKTAVNNILSMVA